MANPVVSRSPAPKIRFQTIWQRQARFEISKIMKIMVWGTQRAPCGRKNRRFRCAAHNVLKNKTWLVEMVYFRSNIILPAAVCRPSRLNRKFLRREVVFERFLWIPLLDLNERPSEYALKYGESSGQQVTRSKNQISKDLGTPRSSRNFENHENHGLEHVQSPFRLKN